MQTIFHKYRFLLMRRITQIGLIALFIGGNLYGWQILKGNLSSASFFNLIPLTDPYAFIQILSAGTIVSANAIIGALIIALFYAIIGGRAFCSWVCTMNIVTDTANWIKKFLGLDTEGRMCQAKRNIRYWALGLSILISILLGVAAFEWISPVSMLHRGLVYGMGFGWIFVATIFIFDLFVLNNGFCGHVCPLGGFYSIIGRFNLIKVRHNKELCTKCMKCIDICPEKHVLGIVGEDSGLIRSGECTNCGRCIEVCDDNAMAFGTKLRI